MSGELCGLKAKLRWAERCWRAATRKHDPKTGRFQRVYRIHRTNYSNATNEARTCSVRKQIADCNGDKRALFRLVGDLTGSTAPQILPDRPCSQDAVDDLSDFFASKISVIRLKLDHAAASASPCHATGCHYQTSSEEAHPGSQHPEQLSPRIKPSVPVEAHRKSGPRTADTSSNKVQPTSRPAIRI